MAFGFVLRFCDSINKHATRRIRKSRNVFGDFVHFVIRLGQRGCVDFAVHVEFRNPRTHDRAGAGVSRLGGRDRLADQRNLIGQFVPPQHTKI